MNYVLKLKTCPDNPAYSCVFEPPNSKLFEKFSLNPPLGLHILPLFEDSKIDLYTVDDTAVSDTPPWSQPEPQICLSLTETRSGELWTQKLKSHLVRTQSLNVLPLKPGVGQYIAIHATLTAWDFFLAYFYPTGPFTCIFFPKPLPIFPVLAVANT